MPRLRLGTGRFVLGNTERRREHPGAGVCLIGCGKFDEDGLAVSECGGDPLTIPQKVLEDLLRRLRALR